MRIRRNAGLTFGGSSVILLSLVLFFNVIVSFFGANYESIGNAEGADY